MACYDNEVVVVILNKHYSKDPHLAHMLRILFFVEALFQLQLKAVHIPGSHNTLTDLLSRNQVARFHTIHPSADIFTFIFPTVAAILQNGLVLKTLDPTVQYFCEQGIASTTRKKYQSALHRFAEFCSSYNIITSFPVSELLLLFYYYYYAGIK